MCRGRYSECVVPVRPRVAALVCLLLILGTALSCGRNKLDRREYQLKGQILGFGQTHPSGWRELSVKHEDIPNFMPAMTMAYYVRKPAQLAGLVPGDLVTATVVLDGGEVYLDNVAKTGHADLPAGTRPVKIMDVMAPGDEVPADTLQDQEGRGRTLQDWRGKAIAVTFVYTRCPVPDFCPLMDRHFAELQRRIQSDPALADRVHLVSVSFDPAHDTTEVIAKHAKARGADPRTWSYLTGTPQAIDHFTSRFGVSAILENDSVASITHNLRTAVIDPRGRLVTFHSGNEWTVDQLLADLRNALAR
jgi:protein SCO1